MGEVLNLFPINFNGGGKTFTVFKSETEIPAEDINKVRYRLFKNLQRPVFKDENKFFVLGEVEEENISIEVSKDKLFY